MLIAIQCGKLLAVTKINNNNNAMIKEVDATNNSQLTNNNELAKRIARRRRHAHLSRLKQWLVLGLLLSLIMFCLTYKVFGVNVNKKLWSVSYVFAASCVHILSLCFVYILCDILKLTQKCLLFRLLSSAGKNPLLIYIGHSLFASALPWHLGVGVASTSNQRAWLVAQLAWTIGTWLATAHYLAHKKLFLRI